MKLKERKNTTLVLLVVCQFTYCYKKITIINACRREIFRGWIVRACFVGLSTQFMRECGSASIIIIQNECDFQLFYIVKIITTDKMQCGDNINSGWKNKSQKQNNISNFRLVISAGVFFNDCPGGFPQGGSAFQPYLFPCKLKCSY